jgi:hypothetical protein
MAGSSPNEELWRRLVALFDFGDRLDFALLEFSSPEIFRAWSAALQARCTQRGQPWSEARPGQPMLDWLEAERVRGLGVERALGPKREREVYLGVIPEGNDERFVFARINENRDNLVRALNGVLCLAGPGDFIRRLAYAAPSIWAMRAETFELRELPPDAVAVPVDSAPMPISTSKNPSFALDVLISAGARDEQEARDLLQRLAASGFAAALAQERTGHDRLEQARFIVVLLSYSYPHSEAWAALQSSRMAQQKPDRLSRKLVPLLLSEGSIPGMFRNLTPLDYRTPGARAKSYVKLVHALRGERIVGSGPGLEAYSAPTLSEQEKAELVQALLNAFPRRDDLSMLLRSRVNQNLDALTSPGNQLNTVFEIVSIAEAEGWLDELLRAAAELRPDAKLPTVPR